MEDPEPKRPSDLNFGERLEWLREEAGLTLSQAARDMKDLDRSVSRQTLKAWEDSINCIGSGPVHAFLALLYQHRDTGLPANLNWVYSDIGSPYVANLSEEEYEFVANFRFTCKESQKATMALMSSISVDRLHLLRRH